MSGAHIAIHAAQKRRERRGKEEEEMTGYTEDELSQGWEFKIVRSATGAFSNPARLQAVLEAEALAGWTLVEKFDDSRVRLKRPAKASRKDALLPQGVDPYRTQYGPSEGQLAFRILAVVTLLGAAVFLAMYLLTV